MEHWQHDTFIVRWRDRGLNADAFLTFSLDPDGKIVQALMVPISPRTDFSFAFQDLRLAPAEKKESRPVGAPHGRYRRHRNATAPRGAPSGTGLFDRGVAPQP